MKQLDTGLVRFKSKRDTLLGLVIWGICGLLIGVSAIEIKEHGWNQDALIMIAVMGGVIALLLWMYLGTYYTLSKQDGLKYQCGPFRGKIDVQRIREITVGKTLWVGFRPATARGGIIIRYDKYNEIYISPDDNDKFVESLKTYNADIQVVR